ncbi:MAG TPA: branched-chain amino acid ABC transporter permease [Candidatus Binatia bacterium]|nr:branched-chain amino acid ABC transporter permease [Candidatus Binatia bacterium]
MTASGRVGRRPAVIGLLVLVGWAAPTGLRSLLMVMMIYAVFAMAYGLLLGHANQPSLGQSLFFGVGAYGFILPVLRLEAGFWSALGVALAAGAAAALAVGALAVRVSEAYHVIFTALLASVAHLIAKNTTPLTGGTGGLPIQVPAVPLGPWTLSVYDPFTNYLLCLAAAAGVYLGLERVLAAPLGRVWVAIRDNEHRVAFLGYRVYGYKLAAFVVAGTLTALSGALYAVRLRYASAEFFGFEWAILPFVWGVLGGLRTLPGPVVGVVLFTVFQYYVSAWWTHYLILFGILIIVILRWLPAGIVGVLAAARQPRRA